MAGTYSLKQDYFNRLIQNIEESQTTKLEYKTVVTNQLKHIRDAIVDAPKLVNPKNKVLVSYEKKGDSQEYVFIE